MTIIAAAAEGAKEASKTPFYIGAGLAAAWAVIVSVLGINRDGFCDSKGQQAVVLAISVAVVAGAMATAVITG